MQELKKFEDSPEMCELKAYLQGFIGTEEYHKLSLIPVNCTDGIKAMAEKAKAFWLVDVICSYQVEAKIRKVPFQLWEIRVKDGIGLVTMREDTGCPTKVSQKIDYTDFPEGTMKFYLIKGVLLLPSEY
jgi:hypothetical protein